RGGQPVGAALNEGRGFHDAVSVLACSASAIRLSRITTVTMEPSSISADPVARTPPRVSNSGSNSDARLAATSTHIRVGLAMGPAKKFPTPFAAPSVRTYAVRIDAAAAVHPKATPQLIPPATHMPALP